MMRHTACMTVLVATIVVLTAFTLVGIGVAFALANGATLADAELYTDGDYVCDVLQLSACP